jgi:hypothetical protein
MYTLSWQEMISTVAKLYISLSTTVLKCTVHIMNLIFILYECHFSRATLVNLNNVFFWLPHIFRWCMENGLESFGVTGDDVLRAYFLAAACIFEPRRAAERLAWARATLLANTISAHLRNNRQDKKKLGCFVRCLDEEADGPR